MTTLDPDVVPAVLPMSSLLTLPFRKGAETLEIVLGPDGPGGTAIGPYNFSEYRARHGELPTLPRYLFVLREVSAGDEIQAEVDYTADGAEKTCGFAIPPRSHAGRSFLIPIPAPDAGDAVLLRFRTGPVHQPGNRFGLIALLGNLAKLAWILGCEKDEIRHHLSEIRLQRMTATARSFSLDRLGEDFGVPRFPPREYSFDADTIALYHFNELADAGDPVKDESVSFGLAGHDGVNDGATSVPAGKFGHGIRIDSSGVKIPSHGDFDIAVGSSFTVEAFVQAAASADGSEHMVVSRGPVGAAGELAGAGWSLSVGGHRGFDHNVRWSVDDGGGHAAEVFADLDIADGAFHHLAGIVDRGEKRLRLFVDGQQRASANIATLGLVSSGDPLWIGRSVAGHLFSGTIDEVRMSRVARLNFHPVLGEGDDPYRQRLGMFEQWLLPTVDTLTAAINTRARINGDPNSFVLVETPRTRAAGGAIVRIVPANITVGQHIDSVGNLLSSESSVVSKDDPDFDEVYLVRHDRPGVEYGSDDERRLMQVGTAVLLDRLLELIAEVNPPVAGNLIVVKAHDSSPGTLHAQGRALRIRHAALAADRLAVLAHRSGFEFVRNEDPVVYVSAGPREKLHVTVEPRSAADTPPTPVDVFTGEAIDVHVQPVSLPRAGTFNWSLVPLGPASAHFVAHPADPAGMKTPLAARSRLRLVADAPGEVIVRVEHRLARRVVTGTRRIRISVESVPASITRDGNRQAAEASASGPPSGPVKPMYLVTSNAPGVDFGGDPNNRKMHVALQRTFDRLLRRNPGMAADLSVAKSFDPNDGALHSAGRAIVLSHAVLAPATLAALLHQAEFDFVERRGATVYASVADDSAIEIVRSAGLEPLGSELVAGSPVEIRARLDPLPAAGSFHWSTDPIGFGRGIYDFVLRPSVRFTPLRPGLVSLQVFFHEHEPEAMLPFTFEIRLNPNLEAANAVVPKPVYDVVMNVLNYFHPMGVEVLTGRLRKHVIEIEQDPQKAFPAYTYPHFRN